MLNTVAESQRVRRHSGIKRELLAVCGLGNFFLCESPLESEDLFTDTKHNVSNLGRRRHARKNRSGPVNVDRAGTTVAQAPAPMSLHASAGSGSAT